MSSVNVLSASMLGTGKKAAILLMALDSKMPGISQQLFSKMGEDKSKVLLEEMSKLGKISTDVIDTVVEEFFSLAIKQDVLIGGKNLTDRLLKDSFGIDDSDDYFSQKSGLFDFVIQLPDKEVLEFLKEETLQTVALLLSLLPDDRAAKLLSEFPVEKTGMVSRMMLNLSVPNYRYLWKFHRLLEEKMSGVSEDVIKDSQQIFKLSRVLEMMVSDTRDSVMTMIKEQDEQSAEKIEQLIFSFPDIVFMSDKDVQIICVEIDPLTVLATAMLDIPQSLEEKLRSNVSDRLKARLDESILQLKGTSEEDIQKAQGEIVQLCRKCEQEGKISPLRDAILLKQEKGDAVFSDVQKRNVIEQDSEKEAHKTKKTKNKEKKEEGSIELGGKESQEEEQEGGSDEVKDDTENQLDLSAEVEAESES
ncbi:hypothetical protein DID78_01445 [Candidatus Marinamargulisbacteria bacterium SCGC AG-343-D04]|nr:hypothetical protein DID78_01445 [Candidatus Marinamargulisbacteria bacterium SCGC AG-343-D04]